MAKYQLCIYLMIVARILLRMTTLTDDSFSPPADRWMYCGFIDDFPACRCCNNTADCSGDDYDTPRLPYIPRLPHDISVVNLSSRQILFIENDDYFVNISGVTSLDLSNNRIQRLSPGAFKPFYQLQVLNFSLNFLNYSANGYQSMAPILSIVTLEKLYLSGFEAPFLSLGPVPMDLFEKYKMPKLTTLWLDRNALVTLHMVVFKPLDDLRELNVENSNIIELMPSDLRKVERLYASNNKLGERLLMQACRLDKNWKTIPLYPKLSQLELDKNQILSVPATHCFPELATLSLQFNDIESLDTNVFSAENFPSLKNINLRQALKESCKIDNRSFSSWMLDKIDLSENKLDFASDSVHADAFFGCFNLTVLNLDGNTFTTVSESKFQRLFSSLTSLKVLTLRNTNLQQLSRGRLKHVMTIRTMHLKGNRLRTLPDGTFDDLENLATLRLDSNLISTVSQNTFSPDMRKRLKSLNLSNNPFECTCSLLWFRSWLQKEPALFDYPNSPYKCSNIAGIDVATFVMNQQQCLLSHEAYVAIVVCFTLFILTLTLVTLLHRYRWHIRLLLYEAYRGERLARWRYRRQEDFQYDLFVSYDSEDSVWVTEHLMPVLEEHMGVRLCVHQRDFIPGKNIVDNILDCLQVSKRVLAVFSPQFAQSQWCHFELNLCLSHVVDNDDVMVVVMLQDVPARDVTGAMSAVMKTTTYIEWGDEADAVASFWRRMTLALTDVLPAFQQ